MGIRLITDRDTRYLVEHHKPSYTTQNTSAPLSQVEVKKQKSRVKVLVALAIVLIALVPAVTWKLEGAGNSTSSGNNSPLSGNNTPRSGGGVTMIDLQRDYDAWKGNFKSYNENDTVLLRDTITSIEIANNKFGEPITILYFKAHVWPSLDDLESGRVQNESWYTWRPGVIHSIFPIKYGYPAYLPEAGIDVKGDVRDMFHVGDAVKITLHVEKGFINDIRPYGGFDWVEVSLNLIGSYRRIKC